MSAAQIIHGLHAVQALLTRHADRVLKVQLARGREDERAAAVIAATTAARIPLERVDTQRLDKLTGGAVHQGVIAEVRPLAPWTEDALIAAIGAAIGAVGDSAVKSAAHAPLVLALDGVQDPHNLGACLRVADAAGAHAVIAPKDKACGLNATAIKVASGAADTVPYIVVTNLARSLREMQEREIWVIGTTADAKREIYAIDQKGPTAWVLGAEGSGMRRLTQETCDELAYIPMHGSVESLNVSVSAGLCLFESRRQRQG